MIALLGWKKRCFSSSLNCDSACSADTSGLTGCSGLAALILWRRAKTKKCNKWITFAPNNNTSAKKMSEQQDEDDGCTWVEKALFFFLAQSCLKLRCRHEWPDWLVGLRRLDLVARS